MIPYSLHFSIGTSISWLKNREYLRVLQNYLPFVDVPFKLVQSRDGLMVHLQDVAGSSGKYPSCDVTLRQQEHSYYLSQFPGFWTWWGWRMSLEKPSTRTVSTCDSFPICNQFYPFDFFYIVFLLFTSHHYLWNCENPWFVPYYSRYGTRVCSLWFERLRSSSSLSFYWFCPASSSIWSNYNIL